MLEDGFKEVCLCQIDYKLKRKNQLQEEKNALLGAFLKVLN